VDLMTGQYAAQAVLAALYQRDRTGRGRRIDLALFDSGVSLTSYYGLESLAQGFDSARYGNAHPSIVPYGVFEAGDGPLVITVGNNAQYRRFCEQVLRRPDLCADPRFATNLDRSTNRAAFVPVLEAELARWRRDDLIAALRQAGIPCGEVTGLREALLGARSQEAGLIVGSDEEGRVIAPTYRLDGKRLPVRRMPPGLGHSTAEILEERLGLGAEACAALKAKGVVR